MKRVVVFAASSKVSTWQGLYGHRLLKGTHLFAALPGAKRLARKLTAKRREAFQKRRDKRNTQKKDYTVGKDGKVSGGPDLQSTAIYPKAFCTDIFQDTCIGLTLFDHVFCVSGGLLYDIVWDCLQ